MPDALFVLAFGSVGDVLAYRACVLALCDATTSQDRRVARSMAAEVASTLRAEVADRAAAAAGLRCLDTEGPSYTFRNVSL